MKFTASKLRIMYCAMHDDHGVESRGVSFEHCNFWPAFQEWELIDELLYFDFVTVGRQLGQAEMSSKLVEAAERFRPDALFIVPFNQAADPLPEAMRDVSLRLSCPTIAWFCDSHFRYREFDSWWAPHLDLCITTAKSAVDWYEADGFGSKVFLSQWAAAPGYKRLDVSLDMNVSFIGQPHGDRQQTIKALANAGLSVRCFGHGWGPGSRLDFEDMVRLFNRSRINLNLSNSVMGSAGPKQIKGRNFEVPACGGFLLTENVENLSEYYVPGREVSTYEDLEELIDKIRFYSVYEGERQRIAQAGYERTINEHTYAKRYEAIFQRVGLI